MDDMPEICFDDSSQIRVLSPEKFDEAKKLEEGCSFFLSSESILYLGIDKRGWCIKALCD